MALDVPQTSAIEEEERNMKRKCRSSDISSYFLLPSK